MTTKTRESLWVSGILCDLDIYWWKGKIQLEASDIDKNDNEIPKPFRLGTKRLLEDEVFMPFSRIESQARIELIRNSYDFITNKIRFVPYSRLEVVLELFKSLQHEFELQTKLFLSQYPLYKIAFLNKYPSIAEKIQHKYPSNNDIVHKFNFSWQLLEMTMPRDVSTTLLSDSQSELLQSEWKNRQEKFDEQLDNWTTSVINAMRKEIVTVCQNLLEQTNEGKIVRPSTLEKAKETLERIKSLNFVDDIETSRQVETIISELPKPDNRDIPNIITGFRNTLDSVVNELKLDTTTSGNLKRSFKID